MIAHLIHKRKGRAEGMVQQVIELAIKAWWSELNPLDLSSGRIELILHKVSPDFHIHTIHDARMRAHTHYKWIFKNLNKQTKKAHLMPEA